METQLKTTTFIFTNSLIFFTVSFFSWILIYEIDNIVASFFIFYVLNCAGAILSYYLMSKQNTKERKEPKQKRYVYDEKRGHIVDEQTHLYVCFLFTQIRSKELGESIADLLNENEQ